MDNATLRDSPLGMAHGIARAWLSPWLSPWDRPWVMLAHGIPHGIDQSMYLVNVMAGDVYVMLITDHMLRSMGLF